MSGVKKFIVRIPDELHLRLTNQAKYHQISLNQLCQKILEKGEISEMDMIVDKIKTIFEESIEGIILFGSKARSDTHDSSDIDLLIVLNEKITRRHYKLLELPDMYSPNFVTFPLRPSGLWFDVAIDGIVLFEKSRRLSNFLKTTRTFILQGGVKRQVTHGQGYWI